MAKTKPFDEHLDEYEQWFVDHHYVFQSELAAIQRVLPKSGRGMEIGIGSGIFAKPLQIKNGIEPSRTMREKARKRGLDPIDGVAEKLPYPDKSYDFALMVTTICFVDDIRKSFREANRVLKNNGHLIIGFVDKTSPVGKLYLRYKNKSLFYKEAVFLSTEEVYNILKDSGFEIKTTLQTVFGTLDTINQIQEPENGYGKGSFIVIKAIKCEKND